MNDRPKIMITGAGGFLGSNLIAMLARMVDAPYDLIPLRRADGDLRNEEYARYIFNHTRPDVVIHAAANCGGIGYNMEQGSALREDNLSMGVNVLHACREFKVSKLVYIGTTCSYPEHCPTPFNEDSIFDGYPEPTNAQYGLAKRALIATCAMYRRLHDVNITCLILANMYGPHDCFDPSRSHVIPALIRKCFEARDTQSPLVVWGTGQATRDFLYVEDAARAIVTAMRTKNRFGPYNIGSGSAVSIGEVAGKLASMICPDATVVYDTDKPDGQRRRQLDITRARDELGWKPETDMDTGLRKTVQWYIDNIDNMG